jgi:hypothetical protein
LRGSLALIKLKSDSRIDGSSWEMVREQQRFSSDLAELLRGKRDFIYSGKPLKAVPADVLRTITETNRDGAVFTTLRNLLINGFVSSEGRSAAGGLAFLIDFLGCKSTIAAEHKRFGQRELERALRFYLGDGMVMEACLRTFESVGHDATVSFDVSHLDDRITVRLKPSFSVAGGLHDLFSAKSYRASGARIVCIDGIVESMSNIDALVRTASACKQPLVIVARGYDANLINTINHNHKRGFINAYPFVVHPQQDFDGFRSMGMDVIDADSYFRLGTVEYEDLAFQSDFMFDHEKMEIALERVGGSKTVEVMVPKRLMSLSGIIEDRMLSGLSFCKEATFSGLAQLDGNVLLPIRSLQIGDLASKALQRQIDGLASIIYVE